MEKNVDDVEVMEPAASNFAQSGAVVGFIKRLAHKAMVRRQVQADRQLIPITLPGEWDEWASIDEHGQPLFSKLPGCGEDYAFITARADGNTIRFTAEAWRTLEAHEQVGEARGFTRVSELICEAQVSVGDPAAITSAVATMEQSIMAWREEHAEMPTPENKPKGASRIRM